jgi:hypothetical protein
LTLLIALAAGGIAIAESDARQNLGAVILGALGAGVLGIVVAEIVARFAPRTTGRPRQVLLRMLAVLLPVGIVLSVVLGSIAPVATVLVFGAMAAPIMWNRR